MKLRRSTPDLIARAFADAVEAGDHEAAEGWLTLGAYAEARAAARRFQPGATTPQPHREPEPAA